MANITCGRCNGTGKHSFNLMHGTMCFGCQGTGKKIVTPKGQKKIAPTAPVSNAKIGDVIEVNKSLGTVTSIRWIIDTNAATRDDGTEYNQVVRFTRLVDGRAMKTWRAVYDNNGLFVVTPDMVGTAE